MVKGRYEGEVRRREKREGGGSGRKRMSAIGMNQQQPSITGVSAIV
jgi:hypothetical protein